jgi:hypothetical protein
VDLERAPVLPYAVRDHEPGIGRRLHARGAGHGGGSLLLGRDPPVGLLELLLDASQEAEQLEARDGFGHVFDSRPVAPEGDEQGA